jgi:2-polyprenyl-3-methyl-5-hydroxy-6-metoxy-1,4-benzoquinol methylase
MLSEKWKKFGVEINSSIVKRIKNIYDVFIGDFINYNREGEFDVITMWDFIDHTKEPLKYLRKAYSLLKKMDY